MSVWFAFGAVIPFILAAVGGIAIEIQIAVFVIVSALLIIFMRNWAKKLLFKNMNEKTNINSIIGKKIRLLEDTDFEHLGSLKINDVTWTAVSHDGKLIKAGQIVEVVKVDGNKLLVKEVEEKANNNESVENTQKDINTDKNKEKIINNNNTNENSEDNEKKSEEETQLIQNSTVAIENSEKTLEEETKINKETKETSDASQGTIIATTDDKKEGE